MKLLDGAMGTRLLESLPAAVLDHAPSDHADLVSSVHASYSDSDALTTATFGLSRLALTDEDVSELASVAIKLARDAAKGRPVIASIGPDGDPAHRGVAATVRALHAADVLLFETFVRLDVLCAALEVPSALPKWATLSFRDGKTHEGATPRDAARALSQLADVVGANCGDGLQATADVARQMVGWKPVLARPSAGVGRSASADAFAKTAQRLWREGVSMVGGCCGVHAAHIKRARALAETEARD